MAAFLSETSECGEDAQRHALIILKEFAVLGHFLKCMCQQHFKPRFGVMIDNFVQIYNSRRLVSDDTLLSKNDVHLEITQKILQNSATAKSLIDDIKVA